MKKVYKFGDILITITLTPNWTYSNWDNKNLRPEYNVTIREKGNKNRHTVKAWGNISEAPDLQYKSLAGIVLEEHLGDPETFDCFCSNYGYDNDSIKALKTYNQLVVCWKNGYWLKLAENSPEYKKWIDLNDDLENFLTEQL
jgi:hypothetical protein